MGMSYGAALQSGSNAILYRHQRSFTPTPPRAKLSREEPDAGNLHVRVCEGWGWQHPHLLGRVDYVFGLARNPRLTAEMAAARAAAERTGKPARRFRDFRWSTLDSWSRIRRVIGKAEWTEGEANPRFIVTSLTAAEIDARRLYERVYCARGEMENRIKEC